MREVVVFYHKIFFNAEVRSIMGLSISSLLCNNQFSKEVH